MSLYDGTSRLYLRSLDDPNVAIMRTYHHDDYGDVAYVDFAEYHYAIRPYLEVTRTFQQGIKENIYIYGRMDKDAYIEFDTDLDTITYHDAASALLDAIGTNNGLDGDMTSLGASKDITIYQGSEKTKVLEEGEDVTIDLTEYNFDLVSEDNHLYVPINVINVLLLAPVSVGICYNGKDYFTSSAIRDRYTSVYARSGNYNSSWMFSNSETPTVLKKVENKLETEKYRFEGVFTVDGTKLSNVVFSLFNNGKGTLNSDKNASFHFAFAYTEDDDNIYLTGAQTMMESDDVEDAMGEPFKTRINKGDTLFGKDTRSEAVAEATYNEWKLTFDYIYGLKQKHAENYLENEEIHAGLTSLDILEYEDAVTKLIYHYIDDIHSTLGGGESVYSSSRVPAYIFNKTAEYTGQRSKDFYAEISRLGTMKNNSSNPEIYAIKGDTAYIKFHLFIHSGSNKFPTKAYTDAIYKTSTYEEAQQKAMSAVNESPYFVFAVAFNDILKHENIKHIVIDLTGNIGGEIRCLPYLMAFLSADPNIVYRFTFDGSLMDYHYKVDLNGDGTYGGEGDTFAGKYKFYILNGANFSAGNEFAAVAKSNGCAKIIGETSAGGSCAIANRVDSNGLTYRLSSSFHLQMKQGDQYVSNDGGVEPDYTLPFDNWYDLEKLDQFFKTLSN